LLHGLVCSSFALEAPNGFLRQRHLSLAKILQQSLPQSQEDLAIVVPALKAGDKQAFKAHLTQMVHNGGTDRIKHCLQALSVAGYRALEVQTWLKGDSAPVPQTKLQTHYLEEKAAKKQREKAAASKEKIEATKDTTEATTEKSDAVTAQEESDALERVLGKHFLTGKQAQVLSSDKMQAEELEQDDEAAKIIGEHLLEAPVIGKDQAESDNTPGIGQPDIGEVKHTEDKAETQEDASSPSAAKGAEVAVLRKLDKQEAELKSSASSTEERISRLEEVVAEEAKARRQMERENAELKAEVAEQGKRSLRENRQLDVASQKVSAQLGSLQEDIQEFRAALGGAAAHTSSS
jgi:hypothetical protein